MADQATRWRAAGADRRRGCRHSNAARPAGRPAAAAIRSCRRCTCGCTPTGSAHRPRSGKYGRQGARPARAG
ncbi:hypothetical protein G6F24_015831 [Rhizopus arrhizus]|nr:hypothetical protein G6F24_015831 [Rhizopus arrhizus]